jgi:radical SAM superfamily enzyme YgiQ (UPF0313 family)
MKILLIKPPFNPHLFSPAVGEPLELEYLASAVKEHEVEILDMRLDKNLNKRLEKYRPDFVGVTAYTCDLNSALDVLKEVKKFNPHISTAIGGHHATFMPYDCVAPFVDAVFLGMSDYSFKDYIESIEGGKDINSVKNIALRKKDDLYFTEKADFNVNLDSLPLPSRRLTRQYRKYYRDHLRNKTTFILTSRGCPYRCTFCACWKLMQGRYITRSPESVVEELAGIPEDVDLVCFADDNSLHSIRRAWRLSDLIKEHKINKKLSMYARADTIVKHPDLIESLRDVGLQYLTVGVEAVKDGDLESLNKGTSVQINNEAIRILQRLGIGNAAHFIVNPDYTEEDFNLLFKYVSDMDLFQVVFTVLTPLPGTELYEENYDRFAIRNYDFFDHVHSILPTKLSRKEFYRQVALLYTRCYSFKRYFKSVLKDVRLSLSKSRSSLTVNPDRLPFFKMILLHVFAYPLLFKFRNIHKTEPLI